MGSDGIYHGSPTWKKIRIVILNRDGWKCQLCGVALRDGTRQKRGNAQVDHIVPRVQGGRTVDENLRALCGTCNARKGLIEGATSAQNGSPAVLSVTDPYAAAGLPTVPPKPGNDQYCKIHQGECWPDGPHSQDWGLWNV